MSPAHGGFGDDLHSRGIGLADEAPVSPPPDWLAVRAIGGCDNLDVVDADSGGRGGELCLEFVSSGHESSCHQLYLGQAVVDEARVCWHGLHFWTFWHLAALIESKVKVYNF